MDSLANVMLMPARTAHSLSRRFAAIFAVGVASLLGLSGCDNKTPTSTPKPASNATTPATPTTPKDPARGAATAPDSKPAPATSTGAPIIIGHYGSLTGSKATFGRSTDNGIKLAFKEVNAAGGATIAGAKRPLKLVSDDTESKAETAGRVVNKLITNDKAVAIIGEVASSISLQGAPVCQQYGVPMISPSSTNIAVTQKGDYIFRVCYIDPFQGFAMAKFAKDELKIPSAAMLVDQSSAYAVGLGDEFKKHFSSMGGTITSEQKYKEGDADFKALLTRIRETKPGAIFIPGYYGDVTSISKQARELGMTIPLLGGDGWDSEELGKNAGKAIEGSFYTNHYAPDQPSEKIKTFVAAYQTEFNAIPDGLAALGYDAGKVLVAALEKAGSTDGKKLRDAIAATKDFQGVTGIITLDANRDAVKPIVVVERKNGNWVFRSVIEPKK